MEENIENNSSEESVDYAAQIKEKDAIISDLQSQFNAVKNKADQLLDETKKAKAKARQEAEAKELAALEKAKKDGDYEQLLKSSESERE